MANDNKLQIQISARLDNVEREFGKVSSLANSTAKKVEGAFGGIGGALKTAFAGLAGGLSVSMFAGFVKGAIDLQDNLNDLSKKTAISVENLSGLSLAAQQSGTDLEGVAQAINKLSVNIGKDGDKFRALGITAKDPIEAFKQLADVLNAIEDPQTRAAVGAAALGKSWASAMPLLAEGGKRIGEIVQQGKELSRITQEDADKADQLNDELALLSAYAKGAGVNLANELVPSLMATAQWLREVTREGLSWNAVMGGIGRQRLSFDPSEFQSAGQIKDLQSELAKLEQTQSQIQKNRFWASDPESVNTMDDLGKKAAMVRTQIDGLQKLGDRKPVETPAAKPQPPSASAIRGLLGGGGKTGSGGGGAKPAKVAQAEDRLGAFITDLDEKQLRGYESALDSFAKMEREAAVANAELTDSQKKYFDLINSADWGTFTEQQQEAIRLAFEMADAAEINADAQKKALDSVNVATDGTKDTFDDLQRAIEGWGRQSAKAIADFAINGATSFSDMAQSIMSDIMEMAVYQSMTKPLFDSIGGLFGIKSAKGNVFCSPGLSAYSGRIVSRPTVFPFASGIGLMGEAGPEAILPLKRGSNGKLGVESSAAPVTVNVINNAEGTQARQQTRQDAGGKTIVDVVVETVRAGLINDIGKGGALAGALEGQYGLNRAAGAWR